MRFSFAVEVAGISILASVLCCPTGAFGAGAASKRADALEESGNGAAAREALLQAVEQNPNDAGALGAYAEFLDRYHERDTRAAYRKWLAALPAASPQAVSTARRLVLLDLIEGDRASADKDSAGAGLTLPIAPKSAAESEAAAGYGTMEIPGPLRSFSRMAAIAQDAQPEEVVSAVARNVVMNGYQASRSSETLEPTEYLKLLVRYVSQARELEKLAGPGKVIKIEACESAQTGELLRVIGFRMRGGCGAEVVLETVNAARAFLTTDSGFPTADLEQALRTNRPFAYDFHPARVPILYGPEYWVTPKEKGAGTALDAFLDDPSLCRFYLGMSKLDRPTADALKAGVPAARLRTYSHVLDFFGGMFEIRDGHAVVPGGQKSAATWGELVGASPDNGAAFFDKLLAKDDGWLASLYDSLARIQGPVQDYLTDPSRMRRFYAAVRGLVTSPGPARPVFRANADMMLLTTRLRLDSYGHPHIPGDLGVWKALFTNHPRGKYDAKLSRNAGNWSTADDVLEALFGLSRKSVENEPLKIFMALSDLDRYRARPLAPGTVDRMAREWREYGPQYSVLADGPMLTDATILKYLDTMEVIDKIKDAQVRADTAASMQALVGIWQICSRHGSVAPAAQDQTFNQIIGPFVAVKGERDVFEAGRRGVQAVLAASGGRGGAGPQERILVLLAGEPANTDAGENGPRDQMVKEMQRVLDAQQIISMTSLFELAENLEKAAQGQTADTALMGKIAGRISEVQFPRPPLSAAEKSALSSGYWTDKHVETERKLNIRALLDKGSPADRVRDVEAALGPVMRDTLVAYNYAHYAPPGAQILYTNPLFVRGHDFVGLTASGGHTWQATDLQGAGWPSNGGGRLVGSLANLPYALAEAEQNFLVPTQTQALIWGDLVPQMILSAKVPRWWGVTPVQLHWVNLHMRLAETMVAEAALDGSGDHALRTSVIEAVRPLASPNRVSMMQRRLLAGDVQGTVALMTPVEMYVLGCTLEKSAAAAKDPAAKAIQQIALRHPQEVSEEAISNAFGSPKPTLANSYRPELLKLRTFPTLMGYSSRIMAESWESNTLYWASLADEMHVTPAQLNVSIPQWTEKAVERIFASHLEDWPALLKSLRTVGEDVRSGKGEEVIASSAGGSGIQ
jgi:hypothetical protein